MEKQQDINVLVFEKDRKVIDLVLPLLKKKGYNNINTCLHKKEIKRILGEKLYGLVVTGEIDGYDSPFDALKDIIMMSPMTSVILISDLPEREVHEKAEGYGIIGHVTRTIPSDDFILLLEQFEKILAVIPPSMK